MRPASEPQPGERSDGRGNWTYDFGDDGLSARERLGGEIRGDLGRGKTSVACFDPFFSIYSNDQAPRETLRSAYVDYLLCRNPCLLQREAIDLSNCIDWRALDSIRARVLAGESTDGAAMPWEFACVTPGKHPSPDQDCGPRPPEPQWHCNALCAFSTPDTDGTWSVMTAVRTASADQRVAISGLAERCRRSDARYSTLGASCQFSVDEPKLISSDLAFAMLDTSRAPWRSRKTLSPALLEEARGLIQYRGFEFWIDLRDRVLRRKR